jgi:hypothetical protein
MRLVNEAPQNEIELKIEDILVESGIEREEVQFRDEERYLRVGYWERLLPEILTKLDGLVVSKDEMYDDDCGWLYMYRVKSLKKS